MTEAQRLWDEHSHEVTNARDTYRLMNESNFIEAIASYNPWITDRVPKREDGDDNGWVLARIHYPDGGVSYMPIKAIWYVDIICEEFRGYKSEWMHIPK